MKTRKIYTPEFKAQALELIATGKPVSELARELGVSSNLLYSWRAGAQIPQLGSAGPRCRRAASQRRILKTGIFCGNGPRADG